MRHDLTIELDTHITVTFELEGEKTRMRLVQRGFPTADMRDGYAGGWASILDGLERVTRARTAGRAR